MSAHDPSQAQSGPNGFDVPHGDHMGLDINAFGAPMLTSGDGFDRIGGPDVPGHIQLRWLC